jgi:Leucine-rich repeat (LRR) protein
MFTRICITALGLVWALSALARHNSDYSRIHFADPNLKECFIQHAYPSHWEKPEDVRELVCGEQYNIKSLRGIEVLSNLQELALSGDNLTTATEIRSLLKLRELTLRYTAITEIDLSRNSQLQRLTLNFNHLETIDTGLNPGIEMLSLDGNELSSIDLTHLPKLQNLSINNNEIEALDLTKNQLYKSLVFQAINSFRWMCHINPV